MNRLQKIASYNLIVIAIVLIIVVLVVGLIYHSKGSQEARGAIGLAGLLGLSGVLFRKKRGETNFDERDQLILRKSTAVAYSVFWVAWIAASMTIWAVLRRRGTVRVDILPIMVLIGGLVVVTVQSVAILIQYGRTAKGEKS